MDYGKSLTYMFDDERWGYKLLIGALVMALGFIGIIIIIGPFLASALMLGYVVTIVENVRRGDPRPLPEWDDIGGKFTKGLQVLIGLFIWALPVIVLSMPLSIAGGLMGDSGDGRGVFFVFWSCLNCLILLYSLFLWLILPAIVISFVEKGTFGSLFDGGRIMGITRQYLAEVVIILIISMLVGLAAWFVGFLLCFVGILITIPWLDFVRGHLYGQLAAEAAGFGGPMDAGLPPDDVPPPAGWDSAPETEVPAEDEIPDAEQMVQDVQERGQQALDEYDDLTVRLDEPAVDEPPVDGGEDVSGGDVPTGDASVDDVPPEGTPPEGTPSS